MWIKITELARYINSDTLSAVMAVQVSSDPDMFNVRAFFTSRAVGSGITDSLNAIQIAGPYGTQAEADAIAIKLGAVLGAVNLETLE
jgi:hypothetical protein